MRVRFLPFLVLLLGFSLAAGPEAEAHKGEDHSKPKHTPAVQKDLPKLPQAAGLPFGAKIGGSFDLFDHHGQRRTEESFAGKYRLIFFGYAKCPGICTVALPRMAEAVDMLSDLSQDLQPLVITVDAKRDTPKVMKEALAAYGPGLLGLTGEERQLAAARKAFQVEVKELFVDPEHGPVYSHGSFIYLMDREGKFVTLFPPILSPERIAELVRKYVTTS